MEDKYVLAVAKARDCWRDVQLELKELPELAKLPDSEKIQYFYKRHQEFYNNFPIVVRYMVCLNQFRAKAFEKYLRYMDRKISDAEKKLPSFKRANIWVRQQAMYVKYLYEANHPHCPVSDAEDVYNHAYSSLLAEFDSFQTKITDAKKKYADAENKSKIARVRELSAVLNDKSSVEDLSELLSTLKKIKSDKAQ
jgi:hypothetical protein